LVATLCGNDASKLDEAVLAAKSALSSRARLWDSLLERLIIQDA
jgi:Protein of unknown function (DUF3050)